MDLSVPWTRMRGGTEVVMCRSEASASTVIWRRSWMDMVMGGLLVPDRFPDHFIDRGDPGFDLDQAAPPQGDHPVFQGLALDVLGLGPL